ncbi:putative hemagglutinin/hemolysin-like protein [Acinetobacter baumannii]|nr:hypothetical protein WP8W18E11_07210 [Acinetobacter baumannii]SSR12942.1 putative hemagglutinin/hemolysin-like protein [Acinetobacter baumannii]
MPEIQIIAKDNHKTLVTTEGTSAKTFRSVSCVGESGCQRCIGSK